MTSDAAFVPDDFVVPRELAVGSLRLEPLGPRHNAGDHQAWTSSIEHIRATPGFRDRDWPPAGGMSLDENLGDLRRHADDFERRTGFTYTVIDAASDIVGCVYIYPPEDADRDAGSDAQVRSWVRHDRADLDGTLHDAVARWLAADWPFARVVYRPGTSGPATEPDGRPAGL